MSLQSNFYATIGTIIAMGIFFVFKNEDNMNYFLKKSWRIIGQEPLEERFPYQVSLRLDEKHFCGGSILNKNTVITSAHCVIDSNPDILTFVYDTLGIMNPKTIDLSRFDIEVGSVRLGRGEIHSVSQIELHEDYDRDSHDYDIALVKVEVPFLFGPHTWSIALPEEDEEVGRENKAATISGWGFTDGNEEIPKVLQYFSVPILDEKSCVEVYEGMITDRMICAGPLEKGNGSCTVDYGGPLVANGKLIGLASWGTECTSSKFPAVYTKVSSLRKWIDEKIIDGE